MQTSDDEPEDGENDGQGSEHDEIGHTDGDYGEDDDEVIVVTPEELAEQANKVI